MAYDKTLAINLGRLDTYDILIKDYIEDKLSISHHNLLINADFRQTVNRNGRTSYTGGNGYHKSIDMWSLCNGTLTVGEDVLSLTSDDEKDCFIDQRIKLDASVKDKTFTFTGLLSDTTNGYGCARVVIIGATGDESIADFVGDYVISGTTSVTVNLADYPDAVYLACRIMNNFPNTTVDIVACKLEFGEEQTLVDIDDNGNITIKEVTDYDEEYLKSSLYSHNTRKFIGMNHSNANMLDNWYFKNPVNRQNLTSRIVGESWSYPMDRWFATRAKLDLTPDGLSLNVMDNPSMDFCSIMQRVKYNYFDTQYTVSAIIDGVLYSETLTSPSSADQTDYSNSEYKDGIAFGLQRLDNGLMNVYVYIRTTTPKVISAVKCELGAVQTLAKQNDDGEWILNDPPANYEIEYVKCIQYDITTGNYIGLNANTVNALSTEGGIVNGDITIAKDTTPVLALKNTTDSVEAKVAAIDSAAQLVAGAIDDENNKATLTLNRETSSLEEAVQLERVENGTSTVYNLYGEHNKPTAEDLGISVGDAEGVQGNLDKHTKDTAAHSDIRQLIEELAKRVNAITEGTDEDLDQLVELIALINENADLIDKVTKDKVNTSDIVNNVTSNDTTKPLSAAQGKVLKGLIDSLTYTDVGAAASNHGTHVTYSTSAPAAAGTASAGSASNVSRGDHVHPAQTSVSGNAGTATKLATARTLTIGSSGKTFDGSGNVSWSLAEIGAAASNHGTHVTYGTSAPAAAGTASAGSASTVSRSDHVHPAQTSVSGNAGTANKVNNSLSIKLNGGTATTFDGSAAKSIDITPSAIGAAAASHGTHLTIGTTATTAAAGNHTHNYAPTSHASSETTYGVSSASNYGHAKASATTPKVAGTAAVGSETNSFARGDHVHPAQTSVSGNAGSANKVNSSLSIQLNSGTATTFDGSAAKSINVTPAAIGAAPEYTYGTEDLTAGESSLTTGRLYFVYE